MKPRVEMLSFKYGALLSETCPGENYKPGVKIFTQSPLAGRHCVFVYTDG